MKKILLFFLSKRLTCLSLTRGIYNVKRFTPYILILLLSFFSIPQQSFAWVYPEHRQILLLAIQNLNPEYRVLMDKYWSIARSGFEKRLAESVIDTVQGFKPAQLDYASWAAIAGDHSCSAEDMLNSVLYSEWILKVADIAAHLKADLAKARNRSEEINAIRNSDIKLQRADLEYATRAGANNVHFLLARPGVNTDIKEYVLACLSPGSPLNALGAYSWFHLSAISKAARYAGESLSPKEKSALMLAALADEAFALHFLEDSYAAGHIAGTWGNVSIRKGTHDYYNEKGLEVVSWDGKRMVMKGDAFMRSEDAAVAATNVRLSIEQFLDAANGVLKIDYRSDPVSLRDSADSFNVCKNVVMPSRKADTILIEDVRFLADVLKKTPVPGLATGAGEFPRFRSEMGTFLGVSAALNSSALSGGFGADQTQKGFIAGVEANVRFGFGMEGVLNEAGDGLVFIQFGWRSDGAATMQSGIPTSQMTTNSITAAIPGRSAYNLRLRLPFWLIPGDLAILGPVLYLISPKAATSVAVTAGNGGLIPWQTGIATSVGRFQFMLGREIGVSLYGLNKTKDAIAIPSKNGAFTAIEYKSTLLDFPFLEWMPFNRSFSQWQSSSVLLQFSAGVNIPYGATVLQPMQSPVPQLKSVWQLGLRVIFDWRHYL
jgi:hypothetical protein